MKQLQINEDEGRRFYYGDFGSEYHGRSSFRLWVHPSLVTWREGVPYLELPRTGTSLAKGQKSATWILRPGSRNLFDVYVPCGYRGGADFEVTSAHTQVVPYEVYRSPVGSLGVSRGALVETEEVAVVYKWHRYGRLYGSAPEGLTKITLDGKVTEFEETDVCEIEDLADIGDNERQS
jgi:hypothetical protein